MLILARLHGDQHSLEFGLITLGDHYLQILGTLSIHITHRSQHPVDDSLWLRIDDGLNLWSEHHTHILSHAKEKLFGILYGCRYIVIIGVILVKLLVNHESYLLLSIIFILQVSLYLTVPILDILLQIDVLVQTII